MLMHLYNGGIYQKSELYCMESRDAHSRQIVKMVSKN